MNRVEIIITADNRARQEVTALNSDVRALSDRLDRAGTSGSSSTRQIAEGADHAGSALARTRVQVEQLSRDLDQASHHYRSLVDADTDVADDRIKAALDRVRDLHDQRSRLLQQMAGLASGGADAGRDGAEAGKLAFSALPAQLRPVLAAAVAGAAPTIVNTLSAAVLLGFGGASLAAGIASAASSPEVSAAFGPLKSTAQTQFAQVGEAFRAPMVAAIKDTNTRLASLDLASVTRPMADTIKPLSDGLNGLVENALPGIGRAVEASAPLVETLADELPEIGSAVSDLADAFADSGDEARETLGDILNFAEVGVRALGYMIEGVSTVTSGFRDFRDWMADWNPFAKFSEWVAGSEDMHSSTVVLNQTTTESTKAFEDAAKAAKGYADDLKRLTGAFDDAWGKQMGIDEATLEWSASLLTLKDAIDDNGKTLADNTEKGIANREALLGSASAAYALFEAEVAMTGSVANAGPKLKAHLEELERNAVAAGLNATQVHALLAQYWALASSPDISKSITIKTSYMSTGTPPRDTSYGNIPTGRIGGYSAGGRVRGGSGLRDDVPALLTGDEVVLSRRDVAALGGPDEVERWRAGLHTPAGGPMVPAPSGSAGGGGTHYTIGSDGSALGDVLMQLIATAVRSAGGQPEMLGIKTSNR